MTTAELTEKFYKLAMAGTACEVDAQYFVRHYNFDGSELQICCSDDDGGFEINIECIEEAIDDGTLFWNEDHDCFEALDFDGYEHALQFFNVVPVEV